MVKKNYKSKKIKTFLIKDGGKVKKKCINNTKYNKKKLSKSKRKNKKMKGGSKSRYINQAYGPWGSIPVKPDSSYYIHENLKSANPPPKALTQYSGTNRPGNNFNINKGVYNYKTNGFNNGPFHIKVTKGGKKKLIGGNDQVVSVQSPGNGYGQENLVCESLTTTALRTAAQSEYDSTSDTSVPEAPENTTLV